MRAVPAVVVTTMAAVAVDLPVDMGAPVMPDLVIATTVDVPALADLKEYSGRVAMASAAAPIAAAEFAVAVVAATPVVLPVSPSATAFRL